MFKKLNAIFILGFLFMPLVSCKKANKDTANVLQASLSDEISSLDPAQSYDTISGSVVYQVYEQLYQYHYLKRPYTLEPLLAESMPEIDQKGTRYTIKIKRDILYHDHALFNGQKRTLKSEDFVTQIKRLAFKGTNSNGWWLLDGKIKGLNEFREKAGNDLNKFKELSVEGLKTPDDYTLIIELNNAYPQLLYALAMSFLSPVPSEAVLALNNNLNDTMIGTGPFKLSEWSHQGILKLSRFKNYRTELYPTQGDRYSHESEMMLDAGKKIPFIDEVVFSIMKESQTRWLNFQSKKIDLLVIPKDNYASAIDPNGNLTEELKSKNIKLHIAPTLTYWWISFNMKDSLVGKNKLLREAIANAIDINKYISVFTNNIGQIANSIYPPGIPGYDPTHKLPFEYNVAKSKELLIKAGFPEGKNLPSLNYDVRGTNTSSRQQAEFIKSELDKIGIKVNIILNTFPAFLEKARKGQLQMWQDGWSMDYPDAENSLQLLIKKNHPPGPNATYYYNENFDKLFDKLKFLNDGPEKKKIMEEMETIVQNELPWIMQYYARNYILYHGYLKNYRHSDLIFNNLKYLKIKKD